MKIAILFILLLSGIGFLLSRNKSTSGLAAVENSKEISPQSIGEVPFANMTIPYLRSHQYESTFGEMTPFSKHANYTSSLTSYTSDGLHINALVTTPTGKMPEGGWPAILFVHGYIAPTIYKTTERYVDYVDYLARNGFVVVKIDLRGHGTSEGIPTGAYYSSGYVIDTLSAYNAVSTLHFVNPHKIGLWGHSMAGNVVLRSFAAKPDIPAVAIWAGAGYTYADLQQYRIHDTSYRPPTQEASRSSQQRALFDAYGQFQQGNPFWKTVVPTNYLNDLTGSIALFHADDDTVVSVEYSRNLNSLLNATSVVHEFHEYPSGGHNINGSSFGKAMQSTVEFYTKHLSE